MTGSEGRFRLPSDVTMYEYTSCPGVKEVHHALTAG